MENKIKIINLADIKLTRCTMKVPDPIMFTKLKQSIKKYGLLMPLIVNNRMELLKGYKRYQALVKLGSKTADVIIITENINEAQLRLELELCRHKRDPFEVCVKLQDIDRGNHNLPLSDQEIDDHISFLEVDKTRFDKDVRKNTPITFF